jgi:hypothetical protein
MPEIMEVDMQVAVITLNRFIRAMEGAPKQGRELGISW